MVGAAMSVAMSLPGAAHVQVQRIIQTCAGNGSPGRAGDGGPATAASFSAPFGIGLDGEHDADAGTAWDAELSCRLDEVEAGTAQEIDRAEFRRRMRAAVKSS
jgi:hypothetical protein